MTEIKKFWNDWLQTVRQVLKTPPTLADGGTSNAEVSVLQFFYFYLEKCSPKQVFQVPIFQADVLHTCSHFHTNLTQCDNGSISLSQDGMQKLSAAKWKCLCVQSSEVIALMCSGSRSSKLLFLAYRSKLENVAVFFVFVPLFCKQVWTCREFPALKGAENCCSRSVLVYTTCR